MKIASLAIGVAVTLAVSQAHAADPPPLVVHEWGTFTSLQDETGRAIGAINTDDEPVPAFVYRANIDVADSTHVAFTGGKGVPILYPAVTMRLETPVLYFHRPANAPPVSVSVDVAFHGGWLTEFYPQAQCKTPGYESDPSRMQVTGLTGDVVGTLDWPKVQIGVGANLPKTQDKVWTTPRQASADPISVGAESEDFLFYRGVGHLDAPLKIERIGMKGDLQVSIQGVKWGSKAGDDQAAQLAHTPMWLVRVLPDGHVRWRRGYSPTMGRHSTAILGDTYVGFADDTIGLPSLHKDLAAELVKAGLFPDEAEAMLNTWEISYFKSPGTRLFFLVPPSWTDATLPLHISGNPRITRVMVGRIEIVTPEQRELIRRIESSQPYVKEPADLVKSIETKVAAGEPLVDAVKKLSPADRAYVLLGRFRDALLIDEEKQHPNDALMAFMQHHGVIYPY